MRQVLREITLKTSGAGLYEFSREAHAFVASAEMETGLFTAFCRHTSASLVIQENADPDVQRDLAAFFRRLVPDGDPLFVHTMEGPDDMPAHVRSILTQAALTIPIADGSPALGTWQGVFVWEHRTHPHRRSVVVTVMGEA
jgi:secondary thiamine-phosphate synthase enzyme